MRERLPPLASGPPAARNEGTRMSTPRPLHILAVNHDQGILDLMRELLEGEGYQVSTMPAVEQDVNTIADLAPDLIVIDYMWPSSGNEWALLNLLTISPRSTDIPVIVCTAAIRHVEELRGHLESIGVRIVHKPFNITDLLAVITTTLQEASRPTPARLDGQQDQAAVRPRS
jgi:DNA-binding response OmpR family regulator